MKQLVMNWYNDGTKGTFPSLNDGVEVKTIREIENGVELWLDIARYIWAGDPIPETIFTKNMTNYPNFDENMCYFLIKDGVPAATFTVICDYEKKRGYIHMVACKPEFRGLGFGNLMNNIMVFVLKREGMESAYLTTDDFRIPAIKSYLKAGLVPDLETEPDFKERWDKVYAEINK